jgi:hypothetical protein
MWNREAQFWIFKCVCYVHNDIRAFSIRLLKRALYYFLLLKLLTGHREYQSWRYGILFKVFCHQFNITSLCIKLNRIYHLLIMYDTQSSITIEVKYVWVA